MTLIASPRALWLLFALWSGMAFPASGATYSLALHAEAPIGKYTADLHGDLGTAAAHYHPLATSAGGSRIWTFCLESQVYFQSGRIYRAEISQGTDSLAGADMISVGTAYLYEQFALGQLGILVPDFTYDIGGGTRLQRMIWWLEDEVGGVQDPAMWSLLNLTFGSSALDDYLGSAVGVLNLTRYDGEGGDSLGAAHGIWRQDQIFYRGPSPGVPAAHLARAVPDGGGTLALLALGLCALRCAAGLRKPVAA
jgi:hypothetical protein